MQLMASKINHCRTCISKNLTPFLDLGPMPLPNGFLQPNQISQPEPTYPLTVGICSDCNLVQLVDVVDPEVMFRNYAYIPSSSQTRLDNFRHIVTQALKFFPPPKNALAIDIGSNDGSLLLEFRNQGLNTLGVDPAENLAKIAQLKGINTLNTYFTTKLARKIKRHQGPATYITATNVVAHINDLGDFFSAIRTLLHPQGIFICEFPYLVDLLQKKLFDTIYQEHLSYFAVQPLLKIIAQNQLKIVNIRRTSIDGGALRLTLAQDKSPYPEDSARINQLIQLEQKLNLHQINPYRKFSQEVSQLRRRIMHTLAKLK